MSALFAAFKWFKNHVVLKSICNPLNLCFAPVETLVEKTHTLLAGHLEAACSVFPGLCWAMQGHPGPHPACPQLSRSHTALFFPPGEPGNLLRAVMRAWSGPVFCTTFEEPPQRHRGRPASSAHVSQQVFPPRRAVRGWAGCLGPSLLSLAALGLREA